MLALKSAQSPTWALASGCFARPTSAASAPSGNWPPTADVPGVADSPFDFLLLGRGAAGGGSAAGAAAAAAAEDSGAGGATTAGAGAGVAEGGGGGGGGPGGTAWALGAAGGEDFEQPASGCQATIRTRPTRSLRVMSHLARSRRL